MTRPDPTGGKTAGAERVVIIRIGAKPGPGRIANTTVANNHSVVGLASATNNAVVDPAHAKEEPTSTRRPSGREHKPEEVVRAEATQVGLTDSLVPEIVDHALLVVEVTVHAHEFVCGSQNGSATKHNTEGMKE